jgi:8-oxo-dGTP diphosphatase
LARTLGVLVYALSGQEVLLMHRHKEPNRGLWIAPGGKVELHESPVETAKREMREETGLVVEHLTWKGFCTEVSPLDNWQWLLFIYVTRHFHGELKNTHREGNLAWITREKYYSELEIPQADAIFAPRILEQEGMFVAKFSYDANLKLVSYDVY